MKDLWKGIAITGIWIGVGVIGFNDPGYGVGAAFFAMFATGAVAG